MNPPQPFPTTRATAPRTGLSITSFVLGLLGVACFLFITGLPAIITGHIARARAKRDPQNFGGAGLALAGLILGYLSLVFTVAAVAIAVGFIMPAIAKQKAVFQGTFRSNTTADQCANNLKQIGLAARIWAIDHNETFPPNFASMSNEIVITSALLCPDDKVRTAASGFGNLDPQQNVSYEYLLPNAKEEESMSKVVFRCPIHGHTALGDGSVRKSSGGKL